jgi:hypothetical protein
MSVQIMEVSKEAVATPTVDEYFHLSHQLLAPANATRSLALSFARRIGDTLSTHIDALSKTRSSVPLKNLLIPPAYKAAVSALLGSTFPAERTFEDFMYFDANTPMLAIGAPEFLVRKTRAAWQRITKVTMELLDSGLPKDASELAIGVDGLLVDNNWVNTIPKAVC